MAYRFGQLGPLLLFRWAEPVTVEDAHGSLRDSYNVLMQGPGVYVGVGIFPLPFAAPTPDVIAAFHTYLDDLCQRLVSVHLILEGDPSDTLPAQVFLSDAYRVVQKGDLYIHVNFDEALVLMKSLGIDLPAPAPAPDLYTRVVEQGFLRDEDGELAPHVPNPRAEGSA